MVGRTDRSGTEGSCGIRVASTPNHWNLHSYEANWSQSYRMRAPEPESRLARFVEFLVMKPYLVERIE